MQTNTATETRPTKRVSTPVTGATSVPPPLRPRNMRIPDAVRYSGLSRSELYRQMYEGKLASRKAGKARLIDVASLDALIDELPTL